MQCKYEVHLRLLGTSESGRGAVLRLEGEELERAGDAGQRVGALDFVLREEGRGGECYHNAELSHENIHFPLSLDLIIITALSACQI